MIPTREPARIAVLAGSFESQQLAFAHLLDTADRLGSVIDLDMVEVIGPRCRDTRLGHYFGSQAAVAIVGKVHAKETLVLLTLPDMLPPEDTAYLRWVGEFDGWLVRARPEATC